jgi:uncharacterized membrane protein
MKPSKLETTLAIGASLFMMLAVFYQPLGLSEALQWGAFAFAFACLIPLLILQNRRLRGEITPEVKAPRSRLWLILTILIVVTLSGPLWLPYTGTILPLPLMLVASVVSCIVSVAVFLLAWRYWRPRV